MKFNAEVRIYADGFLEIEAENKAAARKLIMELQDQMQVHFPSFISDAIDTTPFDNFCSIEISEIEEIGEES